MNEINNMLSDQFVISRLHETPVTPDELHGAIWLFKGFTFWIKLFFESCLSSFLFNTTAIASEKQLPVHTPSRDGAT